MVGAAIRGFRGSHRWLSNFWPCGLLGRNGLTYPTVEHAYQACKFPDGSGPHEACRTAATPGEAKRLGRQPGCRPDWTKIRVDVMRRLLRKKFAPGSELARKLVATGEAELVEENQWNDTFWGVCRGKGQNVMGRLLMEVRAELRR